MGRNFHSICNLCEVQLMHLRGKEGDNMQLFAHDHSDHENMTEVLDDYVKEPPEHYQDMFDDYNAEWLRKINKARRNNGSKLKPSKGKEK